MREALTRLCERAESAVHGRYNIIILSDRMVGPDRILIRLFWRPQPSIITYPQGTSNLRRTRRRNG